MQRYEGTLERFVGDGVLVWFNDPLPQEDHTGRAVRMTLDLRERLHGLAESWRRQGHVLGFGIGVACGYATLGSVGFERRLEYSVTGPVPNLACRLCDEAKPGQILLSQRVVASVKDQIEALPVGDLLLKGFRRPMLAFELISLRQSLDETTRAAIGGKAEQFEGRLPAVRNGRVL